MLGTTCPADFMDRAIATRLLRLAVHTQGLERHAEVVPAIDPKLQTVAPRHHERVKSPVSFWIAVDRGRVGRRIVGDDDHLVCGERSRVSAGEWRGPRRHACDRDGARRSEAATFSDLDHAALESYNAKLSRSISQTTSRRCARTLGSLVARCGPGAGKQLVDGAARVILHARKHVGEIPEGIYPACLAGRDERVESRETCSAVAVVDEEVILAAMQSSA